MANPEVTVRITPTIDWSEMRASVARVLASLEAVVAAQMSASASSEALKKIAYYPGESDAALAQQIAGREIAARARVAYQPVWPSPYRPKMSTPEGESIFSKKIDEAVAATRPAPEPETVGVFVSPYIARRPGEFDVLASACGLRFDRVEVRCTKEDLERWKQLMLWIDHARTLCLSERPVDVYIVRGAKCCEHYVSRRPGVLTYVGPVVEGATVVDREQRRLGPLGPKPYAVLDATGYLWGTYRTHEEACRTVAWMLRWHKTAGEIFERRLSLNELARRFAPEIHDARPRLGAAAHRAMPDILESLDVCRYYMRALGWMS